jgi:hypothetical protein
MIITEYYKTRDDGVVLNRTYSDKGMMLLQNETGIMYSDPVDIFPCPYTYTETEEPADADDSATEEDYQNALSGFGVKL